MSTRFISYHGVRWEVFETPRTSGHGRFADRAEVTSLYFLSRAGSRRSDTFPLDWANLSAKELASLCDSATPLGENAAFTERAEAAHRSV